MKSTFRVILEAPNGKREALYCISGRFDDVKKNFVYGANGKKLVAISWYPEDNEEKNFDISEKNQVIQLTK